MGVRLNAKAVSHLEEISDNEIDLLSKSETVGILLPTTAMIMQLKRPPARKVYFIKISERIIYTLVKFFFILLLLNSRCSIQVVLSH